MLHLSNFLDKITAQRLVDYLKLTNLWEGCTNQYWNKRSINLSSMDEELRNEMLTIRLQVKQLIIDQFYQKPELYCDIFQFVRWQPGVELLPHADSENPDGSCHPYSYRAFASIIYLNNDYEGGNIYFPKSNNFTPQITPGDLVIFPGTLDYLHGVTKITSGTRYTIAGFFTHDPKHHDGYRI
jgi:predicted 2-oxoglutarate/Fe(II)-dependent dioxygenase YbiX